MGGQDAAKGNGGAAAFKFRAAAAPSVAQPDDEQNKAQQQQQQVLPSPQTLDPCHLPAPQIAAEAAQRQLLEAEMTRVLHGKIVLSTALGR
jgi:hypothetical protein